LLLCINPKQPLRAGGRVEGLGGISIATPYRPKTPPESRREGRGARLLLGIYLKQPLRAEGRVEGLGGILLLPINSKHPSQSKRKWRDSVCNL